MFLLTIRSDLLGETEETLIRLKTAEEAARSVSFLGIFAGDVVIPVTSNPRLREMELLLRRRDEAKGAEKKGGGATSATRATKDDLEQQPMRLGVSEKAILLIIAVSQLLLLGLFSFDSMATQSGIAPF